MKARVKVGPCTVYNVYLIVTEDNLTCKIGRAINPDSRRKSFQTGNPIRLRVDRILYSSLSEYNCVRMENRLHTYFREYRTSSASREWYIYTKAIKLMPYFSSHDALEDYLDMISGRPYHGDEIPLQTRLKWHGFESVQEFLCSMDSIARFHATYASH